MTFHAAYWIVLLPALIALAWRYPSLQLAKPLRALLMLLLIAMLAEPQIQLTSTGLDLWVLVDKSASAKTSLGPKLREWERLLESTKGRNDRLNFVDFADVTIVRGEGDSVYFDKPRDETRIPLAVRSALSKIDRSRNSRLLLFSDGYGTDPLQPVRDLLEREGIALDYRLAGDDGGADFRIERISAPSRVQADESFLIEIVVTGTQDLKVPLKLQRDGQTLVETEVELHNHRAVLRLSDQLSGPAQAYRYTARTNPPGDRFPGNNWGESFVEIQGPRSVLVVSGYDNDPLQQVLAKSGVQAITVDNPETLSQADLTGRSVVVLNNIAAHKVSRDFVKALPFFVQSQGGGLLMVGGQASFGSGGWFQSEIDPLLPVSMELREEERRISAAMVVVLDRSGSMGAQVQGNMGNMSKMTLADEGAARTISLLGSTDQISGNREEMMAKARSVTVGGGGIFVYTGLKAAWEELKKVNKAVKRHIVLFADAADAEEPGEYKKLLAEITKADATVSVIGLGSDHDSDADFLKDVAKLGKGRVFFVSNAVDLPAVFAQETVSVARSTFVTDPTPVAGTVAWREISPFPIAWPAGVDGYNLNYVRPNSRAPLITKDEYSAPVIAAWQRGIGRTGAISAPIAGAYSEQFRKWNRHGDLLETLLGWLRGPELPPGIGIKTRIDGTTLSADLFYEKSWEEKISTSPPQLLIVGTDDSTPRAISWERLGPGHFRTSKELASSEVLRGVVQFGDVALPFGPIALGRSAEWDFDRNKIIELQSVAHSSGGVERVNLADVWRAPQRREAVNLFKPLLLLFLVLFLTEALLTRLGRDFEWPKLRLPSGPVFSSGAKRRKTKRARVIQAAVEPVITKEPKESITDERQSIFDKAKRGGL
jgi:uncharacterized membrane protein